MNDLIGLLIFVTAILIIIGISLILYNYNRTCVNCKHLGDDQFYDSKCNECYCNDSWGPKE